MPEVSAEALVNVLRTLLVWVSWIHEDVGHSAAALVYDPIYTPGFVPSDGVGIPVVPYALSAMAYRSFVFLERGKLLDDMPLSMFSKKVCKRKFLFFHKCSKAVRDRQCFLNFQSRLRELSQEAAFRECDERGLYSCVSRVEASASS